ncbi:MAG: hypothetical protein PHQ35_11505, partial [Phycisphaerae bacterium]|nr:hypothetical protein [Phycisphaerae bacterium]
VGTIHALRMTNPVRFAEQMGIDEGTYSKILNRVYGEGNTAKTLREMVDDAMRKGVISESQQGFDPLSMAQKIGHTEPSLLKEGVKTPRPNMLTGTTINLLPTGILKEEGKEFVGVRMSREVGNIVENTPRFESFLIDYDDLAKKDSGRIATLIKDGLIKEDQVDKLTAHITDYAALEAKKWFLDYGDLTDFEKNVLKKVFPFYSWIRKNLANQVSGILLYPGMYALVPKAEDFLRYKDPEYDESLVPDYMRQLGYFPISKHDKNVYSLLNPNLPFQDLARIPIVWDEDEPWRPKLDWTEVKDDIVGAAHPLIKSVVEMIPDKGYDTWRKKDLDARGVAPGILQVFTKTPKTLQTIDGLLRHAGFKRGLDPKINEEGKLELNSRLLKLLENNVPLVRMADQFLQTERTVLGQDRAIQEAYEAMTHEKTEFDALNRFFNVLSYWGGLKQRAVDLSEEERRKERNIYKRAQELYGERDLTREEVRTRLQRREKENERVRRLVR